MARKLYGAAARAHAKKASKTKRRRARRNPSPKSKRKAARKAAVAKKTGKPRKKSPRNPRFDHKAFAARTGKYAHLPKAGTKQYGPESPAQREERLKKARAAAKRRRAAAKKKSKPKKRKKAHARKAAPKRKHHRRARRRGGRWSTAKSMRRARRTIRNSRMRPGARSYKRRYHMRSNPSSIKDFAMILLPVAAGLYGSRLLTGKFGGRIPGLDKIPAAYRGPAVAGAILVGTHFATKKIGALGKYRTGLMIGTGLNFLDRMLAAFAPGVAGQIGVGNDGMGDYVQIGDYMQVGATPIDDDMTLSDYVQIGAEEELGLDEELGLNEELGASTGLSRAYLGGVSQSSMMKQIPSRPMFEAIPSRSFTKQIPDAGSDFDQSDRLYGGIFGGGF